jgi:lipoate-protein ligase A
MSEVLRVLEEGKGPSSWNMAVDEALLRCCRGPVVRYYGWQEPAVSIGYFQKITEVPEGRPFVRRYTGGGLVDHAVDFTYTLVLPAGHPLVVAGTSKSYEAVHGAVVEALLMLGLPAELAACSQEEPNAACFLRPVRHDVMVAGKKAAGAAQRRGKQGCLHQGSVVLAARMDWSAFRNLLTGALAKLLEIPAEPSVLTLEEKALAESLDAERYAAEAWNRAH